jgi:hypothetical protein
MRKQGKSLIEDIRFESCQCLTFDMRSEAVKVELNLLKKGLTRGQLNYIAARLLLQNEFESVVLPFSAEALRCKV